MAERVQWEYQVEVVGPEQKMNMTDWLNELGEKGWEVAATIHQGRDEALIVKRPQGWG